MKANVDRLLFVFIMKQFFDLEKNTSYETNNK